MGTLFHKSYQASTKTNFFYVRNQTQPLHISSAKKCPHSKLNSHSFTQKRAKTYFHAWRGWPDALRKYLSLFHFCHLPTNLLLKSLYILLRAASMAPHRPVNLQITRLLCGFIWELLAPRHCWWNNFLLLLPPRISRCAIRGGKFIFIRVEIDIGLWFVTWCHFVLFAFIFLWIQEPAPTSPSSSQCMQMSRFMQVWLQD